MYYFMFFLLLLLEAHFASPMNGRNGVLLAHLTVVETSDEQ